MVAVAALQPPHGPLQPGQVVSTTITVRNAGSEVDSFAFETVGGAAEWTSYVPETVNLLPGAEETVTIVLSPPRAPRPLAGPLPLGVKITPVKTPEETTTEECTLDILPFVELATGIEPTLSRGSRQGRHEFTIENLGNRTVEVELSGFDDDDNVRVETTPTSASLAAGDSAYVALRVRPRKKFFRGQEKKRPFKVLTASADLEPRYDQATFAQRPMLPKWFWKAVLLALLLLALLIGLFLWAKNDIESSARQVAEEQAEETVAELVPDAGGGGGGGGGGEEPTPEGGGTDEEPPPEAPEVEEGGEASTAFRLTLAQPTIPLAEGQVLRISDILFSNPDGEAGRVRVRSGTRVLIETNLQNFRDLDQHFRTPLEFTADDALSIEIVGCGPCTSSVTFSGVLSQPADGS